MLNTIKKKKPFGKVDKRFPRLTPVSNTTLAMKPINPHTQPTGTGTRPAMKPINPTSKPMVKKLPMTPGMAAEMKRLSEPMSMMKKRISRKKPTS